MSGASATVVLEGALERDVSATTAPDGAVAGASLSVGVSVTAGVAACAGRLVRRVGAVAAGVGSVARVGVGSAAGESVSSLTGSGSSSSAGSGSSSTGGSVSSGSVVVSGSSFVSVSVSMSSFESSSAGSLSEESPFASLALPVAAELVPREDVLSDSRVDDLDVPDDDEPDDEPEELEPLEESARATPGMVAADIPKPSAIANPPTRDTYFADSM
ncbi:MAG: hypothetical protein U1D00_02620 [Mycobacterium sp.]|nr:hypothetical protein [Mycobacterium sp.]